MTDTSIFNENKNPFDGEYDNPGEVGTEGTESLIDTLVGDGKKFKDVEALAKGKILSDAFIERLKEENRLMREEKTRLEAEKQTQTRLEDFMKELRQRGQQMTNGNNQTDENPTDQNTAAVDLNAIVEKALAELEQRKRVEEAKTAVSKVVSVAQKTFGSSWQEGLKKLGSEMGMDPETMDMWAKRNPDAIVKLIEATTKRVVTPDLPSTISTSSLQGNTNTGLRNKAFYDKIKAKDPRAFWNNQQLQIQMHRDAQKLGDKFFE